MRVVEYVGIAAFSMAVGLLLGLKLIPLAIGVALGTAIQLALRGVSK